MPKDDEKVSLREIAEMAGGVTVPAVANWRKRFDDFPRAVLKEGRTPLFDRAEVSVWLSANNRLATIDDHAVSQVTDIVSGLSSAGRAAEELLLALRGDGSQATGWSTAFGELSRAVGERQALEAVLARLSKSAGRQLAEFDVHLGLLRLLSAVSETPPGATIYDPCIGTGRLAAALAAEGCTVIGQDINSTILGIAERVLSSSGLANTVEVGDILIDDRFPEVSADRVCVIGPPLTKVDANSIDASDPRWIMGAKALGTFENAIIQIALAHLAQRGRALICVSSQTLRSGPSDLREFLIRQNLLDAVISLPPGIACGTAAATALLVIDRARPSSIGRSTPVLMADLTDRPGAARGLSEEKVDTLIEIWKTWDHEPVVHELACAVDLPAFVSAGFDLTPTRYLAERDFEWPSTSETEVLHKRVQDLATSIETVLASCEPPLSLEPQSTEQIHMTPISELGLKVIRGNSPGTQDAGSSVITSAEVAETQLPLAFPSGVDGDFNDKPIAALGDVIITVRTPPDPSSNRVVRVGTDMAGREVSRELLILRPDTSSTVLSAYLYFWLATPLFRHHLELKTVGSVASRVTARDILSFEIPLTPRGFQERFVSRLQEVHQQYLNLRQDLFTALDMLDNWQALVDETVAAEAIRPQRADNL